MCFYHHTWENTPAETYLIHSWEELPLLKSDTDSPLSMTQSLSDLIVDPRVATDPTNDTQQLHATAGACPVMGPGVCGVMGQHPCGSPMTGCLIGRPAPPSLFI